MSSLKGLVADNPAQVKCLDEIDELVQKWHDTLP